MTVFGALPSGSSIVSIIRRSTARFSHGHKRLIELQWPPAFSHSPDPILLRPMMGIVPPSLVMSPDLAIGYKKSYSRPVESSSFPTKHAVFQDLALRSMEDAVARVVNILLASDGSQRPHRRVRPRVWSQSASREARGRRPHCACLPAERRHCSNREVHLSNSKSHASRRPSRTRSLR